MNVARTPLDGHPGTRLQQEHVGSRADFEAKFVSSPAGMRGIDAFRYLRHATRAYTYHGEPASSEAAAATV
ncbi:hypothetical protein B0O99DRAFT_611080 [Bisporella sp. PMI_857]|nr:hypothetical protein B0O99DRAFT_612127 [Bisporella sp. PMI_857]KAH8600585.1 hypothetical protein B0O99DRAFT_611080 [Bisporella sp. PMI_857]